MISSRLRPYWHPVAEIGDVEPGPIGVRLLDEELVLWRRDGEVVAARDLCIHRGSRLSQGWVDPIGCVVCPYHGWRYDGTGTCVFIPSQPPDDQRIPSRARTPSYRAAERYGLVWVALEEPREAIPEFPQFDDPSFHTFCVGRFEWRAGADRFVENAIDVAHLPFVHPGLLGDRERSVIPPYEVRDVGGGFYFSNERNDVAASQFGTKGEMICRETWVRMPFSWRILITSGRGLAATFVAVQPVSSNECRFWPLVSRTYALDVPDEEFGDFDVKVIEQDRAIVENQRPEMLPLDITAELHVKVADAASIEYRRRLREIDATGGDSA
jgi:phenylpropionate dioxygenase-like ring-hydroxylating dioxygenase large terminal subunit